ncbi:hypothetical protein EDC63_113108, partial [Sulfurirhabdus autotrophica]
FRLAGQKGSDATASRPLNQHYSKLHFILESAEKDSATFLMLRYSSGVQG